MLPQAGTGAAQTTSTSLQPPSVRRDNQRSMHSTQPYSARPTGRIRPLLIIALLGLLAAAYVTADWWIGIPATESARYVGRQSCVQCHQEQIQAWTGSDHDLAMDRATAETVLGDFHDAELQHHGITSKMFRRDGRYLVRTEGPDGQMSDFPIKYVFGYDPLQQYLVEFDRQPDMPDEENARLQVLRISWDTHKGRWFYLDPPDVQEKLAPGDPLHWTGSAQNWNHMCADCHSTNVRKNFDVRSRRYHTTFSEIDVSCESCHGPASQHVQMATSWSPFWDRRLGYGLRRLKGQDNDSQIDACAACHSRRRVFHANDGLHDRFYDCFENELLGPNTYYADGQIRDEVYVYGSFTQSKMYHKGVRCSDCHDPHSTRLKATGNQLCTSCHTAHSADRYDTPAHHHHRPGEPGSGCADCHMPQTPFMKVDLRADHSIRVPRPDLSVSLGTPNACTGCHLDASRLPESLRSDGSLQHYADWLEAARTGNQPIAEEVQRTDKWSLEKCREWFPVKQRVDFAPALDAAWHGKPRAVPLLEKVVGDRSLPAIARASSLSQLGFLAPDRVAAAARRPLRDSSPQLRSTAATALQFQPPAVLLESVQPLLNDQVRLVRTEAARVMAHLPATMLKPRYRQARDAALTEYREGLLINADQAGSHMALGILAERMGHVEQAIEAYRTAIHVQPDVAGPRSNLATLLERMGKGAEAARLRAEELSLLQRDAALAPNHPAVQYRYGLALYLNGHLEQSVTVLKRACQLDPTNLDYRVALTLLLERLQHWPEALESARQLRHLAPQNAQFQQIEQQIFQQSGGAATGRSAADAPPLPHGSSSGQPDEPPRRVTPP